MKILEVARNNPDESILLSPMETEVVKITDHPPGLYVSYEDCSALFDLMYNLYQAGGSEFEKNEYALMKKILSAIDKMY